MRRVLTTLALSALIAIGITAPAEAATVGIRVDFTKPVAKTGTIGFSASEFGVEGGTVPSSTADQATLKELGAQAVRLQLKPDGRGGVIGGAGGADASISGERWLDTYEVMGLTPTVIVALDATEATTVQSYLFASGHEVHRWIVGNEMDANSKSNVSQDTYVQRFGQVAAALRQADPNAQIGGPAVACWDCLGESFVRKLVALPASQRPSFIDWHEYGSGDGTSASMTTSYRYGPEIDRLKTWLPADGSVGIQVGEFNMNWGNEPANNTPKQSVWDAVALGTIVSRGATAFQYADKNNALGLVASGKPKASYWGLGMFTGASQFRPFGATAVTATSSTSGVRVFASTNAKTIVVANITTSGVSSNLNLTGYGNGTAQRWTLHGNQPRRDPDLTITNGRLPLWLPAMSVQTLILS